MITTGAEKMMASDPHGLTLTLISLMVVFGCLLILYGAYSLSGAIFSGKFRRRKVEPTATESSVADPVEAVAAAPRHEEGFVGKVVRSPLPGVLIELNVREGQNVRRGQKLAVLEAMKMENEILAEADGVVKEVFVQKGDSVLEGAKIVSIG